MGYPLDLGWGTPRTGMEYPLDLELGTPRPGTGYPPGPGTGYPPSIASNCYVAGSMPLAFTQRTFLLYFGISVCSPLWGVPCARSGGYPISGLVAGGVTYPRSGQGVPHPRSGWGYPIPGQPGGYRISGLGRGNPLTRSGWGTPWTWDGVPPDLGWVAPRPRMGYPPDLGWGTSPWTWY